jgi:hypothetical protein
MLLVLMLCPEFADFIREGYSEDSFYGDGGECTKDNRIRVRRGYL